MATLKMLQLSAFHEVTIIVVIMTLIVMFRVYPTDDSCPGGYYI